MILSASDDVSDQKNGGVDWTEKEEKDSLELTRARIQNRRILRTIVLAAEALVANQALVAISGARCFATRVIFVTAPFAERRSSTSEATWRSDSVLLKAFLAFRDGDA